MFNQEKEGLHSNEETSDRRNILAVAAERRMKMMATRTPETVERGRVSPDMFNDEDINRGEEETEVRTWPGCG